ncbi:MAG TPA: proline dehydrogenase family protein [Candidatus Nanopelagicales bacterium]|nr:proline dehydrogenase family protein [Candidatus Nanopelagicales bacterium]
MLRSVLLSASRSDKLRQVASDAPPARALVNRFVAGETAADAVRATGELVGSGRLVTIDRLGEDTLDLEQAHATRDAYLELLTALGEAGLTGSAEVSVKLSAVGQALPGDGEKIALENARAIAERAGALGTTVTLDMEDHTTTDSTLGILRELRTDFPGTGAVIQAYLRRSEGDCRDLATEGSRVRLCKGAYNEPEGVAFQARDEVDRAYVRCMKILMQGDGYPMLATHDPRLVEIGGALAVRSDRAPGTYEFQMLYGVRTDEQERLAAEGEKMRVYVPYGDEWYGYLVRRLAERPANLSLLARALVSKG